MTHEQLEWLCSEFRDVLQEELEERIERPLQELAKFVRTRGGVDLAVGQMWTAQPRTGSGLHITVVLTHVSSVLRAVVASGAAFVAGHDDIVVSESESPTGSELLLCAWTDSPVDRSSLGEFVGEIGPHTMRALLMFLQREITGDYELRAIHTGESEDGLRRVSWGINPAGSPESVVHFETGTRILDDEDPRARVREVLSRGTSWMLNEALEGVFAPDDVPDFVAWYERAAARIREAIERMGELLPGAPDEVPGLAMGLAVRSAVIPYGGVTGSVAEASNFHSDKNSAIVAGFLPCGNAEVEVRLALRRDSLRLWLKAVEEGKSRSALAVRFVSGTHDQTVRTNKDGLAWLTAEGLLPDDVKELIIGRGADAVVIEF